LHLRKMRLAECCNIFRCTLVWDHGRKVIR
jgi:hypothetical protein